MSGGKSIVAELCRRFRKSPQPRDEAAIPSGSMSPPSPLGGRRDQRFKGNR